MQKINFSNLPSQTTPVNATNMNLMQTYIDEGKINQLIQLSGQDLNSYTDTGVYFCLNCTNTPGINGYLLVAKLSSSYCTQHYCPFNSNNEYSRRLNNGTWTAWELIPAITEGAWTPALQTTDGNTVTVDYTRRDGSYKKVGNLVFISFFIEGKITGFSTSTKKRGYK